MDWSLARQVARFAAGSERAPATGLELPRLVGELEGEVATETGLELRSPTPPPELLSRGDWCEMNLDAVARLLGPVVERLDGRFSMAGPLAGPLRLGAGATLAAEAGLVFGYLAHRVLGQYELSLLQPEVAPRLVFLPLNIERAARELEVEREGFQRWIVIHELTHVFQFQGVGWLREHLAGLVRKYMRTVEVRIESGAAGGLPAWPDLSRLVETFREGGLAALVQTGRQRELMRRIQAAMAVIEGYSDHVMDRVGSRLLPEWAGLRSAMERRRRSRSAPERILERLLGFDLKLRQYELGGAFCSAVAAEGGMDLLNRAWKSPSSLPTLSELGDPPTWIDRVAAPKAA